MNPMTELPNMPKNTVSEHSQTTCSIMDISIASNAPVHVQESNVSTFAPAPVPASAPAPAPAKQRKNVDFNACELVDAMMIAYYANILTCVITTVENIHEICQGWMETQHVPSCIRLNDFTDLPKYISDLMLKKACVSQRIIAFKDLVASTTSSVSSTAPASGFKFTDIVCIYVSGKKNAHKKIHALNAGLDIKQQKGDIYIEYATGEIIGWSCKQSSYATKSNYSVHKILGVKELNQTKSTFLAENGFPKFSKDQRDSVNQLFYPKNKNNKYWDAVRHAITNNKSVVIDALVKGLTGYTIPYSLYEFDGSSFHSLNTSTSTSTSTGTVTFEEHANYYKMKNGEERSAAKLFYQLCISQKKYRVEIRWKGNVHDASPQFQIHADADADADAEETVAVAAPPHHVDSQNDAPADICEQGMLRDV